MTEYSAMKGTSDSSEILGQILNFRLAILNADDLYRRWISHYSRNLERVYEPLLADGRNSGVALDADSMLSQLQDIDVSAMIMASRAIHDTAESAAASCDSVLRVRHATADVWQGDSADAAEIQLDVLRGTLDACNRSVAQLGLLLSEMAVDIHRNFVDMASDFDDGAGGQFRPEAYGQSHIVERHLFIDRLDEAIDAAIDESDSIPGGEMLTRSSISQSFRHMPIDLHVNERVKDCIGLCSDMDNFAALYSDAVAHYRRSVSQGYEAVSDLLRSFAQSVRDIDFSYVNSAFAASVGNAIGAQSSRFSSSEVSDSCVEPAEVQSTMPADQSAPKPATPTQVPLGSTDVIPVQPDRIPDENPFGHRRLLELGEAPLASAKHDERRVMGEPSTLPKACLSEPLSADGAPASYSTGRINHLLDNGAF